MIMNCDISGHGLRARQKRVDQINENLPEDIAHQNLMCGGIAI